MADTSLENIDIGNLDLDEQVTPTMTTSQTSSGLTADLDNELALDLDIDINISTTYNDEDALDDFQLDIDMGISGEDLEERETISPEYLRKSLDTNLYLKQQELRYVTNSTTNAPAGLIDEFKSITSGPGMNALDTQIAAFMLNIGNSSILSTPEGIVTIAATYILKTAASSYTQDDLARIRASCVKLSSTSASSEEKEQAYNTLMSYNDIRSFSLTLNTRKEKVTQQLSLLRDSIHTDTVHSSPVVKMKTDKINETLEILSSAKNTGNVTIFSRVVYPAYDEDGNTGFRYFCGNCNHEHFVKDLICVNHIAHEDAQQTMREVQRFNTDGGGAASKPMVSCAEFGVGVCPECGYVNIFDHHTIICYKIFVLNSAERQLFSMQGKTVLDLGAYSDFIATTVGTGYIKMVSGNPIVHTTALNSDIFEGIPAYVTALDRWDRQNSLAVPQTRMIAYLRYLAGLLSSLKYGCDPVSIIEFALSYPSMGDMREDFISVYNTIRLANTGITALQLLQSHLHYYNKSIYKDFVIDSTYLTSIVKPIEDTDGAVFKALQAALLSGNLTEITAAVDNAATVLNHMSDEACHTLLDLHKTFSERLLVEIQTACLAMYKSKPASLSTAFLNVFEINELVPECIVTYSTANPNMPEDLYAILWGAVQAAEPFYLTHTIAAQLLGKQKLPFFFRGVCSNASKSAAVLSTIFTTAGRKMQNCLSKKYGFMQLPLCAMWINSYESFCNIVGVLPTKLVAYVTAPLSSGVSLQLSCLHAAVSRMEYNPLEYLSCPNIAQYTKYIVQSGDTAGEPSADSDTSDAAGMSEMTATAYAIVYSYVFTEFIQFSEPEYKNLQQLVREDREAYLNAENEAIAKMEA